MPKRFWRIRVLVLAVFVAGGPLAGCDDGDDKLENRNPGNNDLQVVVAFGDSITNGQYLEGAGTAEGEAWPAWLKRILVAAQPPRA